MSPLVFDAALAALLGLSLGLGLWSMLAALPRWGVKPLMWRVAPYIRDVTDAGGTSLPRFAPADPASLIVGGAKKLWRRIVRRGAGMWGSADALATRIARAGWNITASTFRERQLSVAIAVAFAASVLAVVLRTFGHAGTVFVVPLLCAIATIVGAEWLLSRAAARRQSQAEDELPTVLEFLALCLSAGEGLLDAIKRTSAVGSGQLSAELRAVVVRVATGTALADALTELARRVDVPGVGRAIDQLVAALDRGAPLAAVLKDQAVDARDEHKRVLLERAGKNEVLMLLPLVFLILPLSVAIAIFPGITLLNTGF